MKEFTDDNFAQALAEGMPVVVDFWAPWCGPCRAMSPIVEELEKEYAGRVVIGKMNVDDNEDTPSEFGIMSIPTILFFKNGQLVNRLTGASPKAKVEELIQALL